jgi:hypothetical protein
MGQQNEKNGHLPSHVAWISYRHPLWPGLRYRLETMTNDMDRVNQFFGTADYKTLNILGIVRNVNTGLRKLTTTFEGFGLFSLPIEQLISRVNMFLQHYHVFTNLSKKLNASLRYLQLQLGTPHNPLTMDYKDGDT